MNDREIYQQEKQAILDDYEEELKELKEISSNSNTDAKPALEKQIEIVELKLKDARAKLEAASKASEEEIASYKKKIDDTFRELNVHLSMS